MKRRFSVLAAVLILFAGLLTVTAYGAEAAVVLDCPEQVVPESSFSAALTYEGAAFGSASVEVSYDPELLEFRSCSGGEGFAEDGIVRITLTGTEGKVYLSCKIRFKALAEGDSFITATTSAIQDAEGNELAAETRSVKVCITEAAAELYDKTAGNAVSGENADTEENVEEEDIYILRAVKDAALRVTDGFAALLNQLSVTEFILFSMCLTLILLLLILLAVERRR